MVQKKIGYVNLDSSTAAWLVENLPTGELQKGIRQLTDGEYGALMLETGEAMSLSSAGIIRCGGLAIHERSRRVELDGQSVALTPKEFDILLFLKYLKQKQLHRR